LEEMSSNHWWMQIIRIDLNTQNGSAEIHTLYGTFKSE
jgi:hypothetical protein